MFHNIRLFTDVVLSSAQNENAFPPLERNARVYNKYYNAHFNIHIHIILYQTYIYIYIITDTRPNPNTIRRLGSLNLCAPIVIVFGGVSIYTHTHKVGDRVGLPSSSSTHPHTQHNNTHRAVIVFNFSYSYDTRKPLVHIKKKIKDHDQGQKLRLRLYSRIACNE
jgi:hypothetical protein